MANYTNTDGFITPLVKTFQAVLPLVFDDSLTYYEQQARIVEKLNEVIDFTKINSIKYANPLQWDITEQYESNTVVVDKNGNAYLSVQPVPAGISINRTDYWTKIGNFDALWSNIKSALTPYDEGADNAATRSYNVDDLVWVQDELYIVTKAMVAGDKFLSGNSKVTSMNVELARLRKAIEDGVNAEKEARTAADNEIISYLAAETEARIKGDKDCLSAVANEEEKRVNSDDNLQNSIDALEEKIDNFKDSTFTNVSDYGVTPDLADATAKINSMIAEIGDKSTSVWFTEKINVNGEVTFPANIDVGFNGGCIVIGTSGKVTINSAIIAGRKQIFSGATNANVVINNTTTPTLVPEWFNNTDIQLAIDLGHYVSLGAKDYTIVGGLTINKSNFSMYGYGPNTEGQNKATRLIFQSGNLTVGDTGGAIVNNFPRDIRIGKLTIHPQDSTLAAMSVYGVINGLFEDMHIDSFVATDGILCVKNVHTYYKNIYIQSTNQSYFKGFHCGIEDNPILAGNNASLYFENCVYVCAITNSAENHTIGWFVRGACSDLYLNGCETTEAGNGIAIQDSTRQINDVLIDNCIFDACRNYCMFFGSLTGGGTIQIANTYIANASGSTAPLFLVTNNTNMMFLINGLECVCTNTSVNGINWASSAAHGIITAAITGGADPIVGTVSNLKGFYYHNGTVYALA